MLFSPFFFINLPVTFRRLTPNQYTLHLLVNTEFSILFVPLAIVTRYQKARSTREANDILPLKLCTSDTGKSGAFYEFLRLYSRLILLLLCRCRTVSFVATV